MKTFLISMLFVLINWTYSVAASDLSTQDQIIKKLPGKLAKVEWKQQSPTDIEKSFGAPKEKESKEDLTYFYYSFDGIKFDTSVIFKNGKLSHVVYIPGNTPWTIKDFQGFFAPSELAKAEDAARKKISHESGRDFSVENIKAGLQVKVATNSKNSVRQMTLWQPGESQP